MKRGFYIVSQVQDRNTENRSPPTYHTKKGAVIWPPADEQNKAAKDSGDDDVKALPRKRVSDLIARFNSGSIENGSGNKDVKYKSGKNKNKNIKCPKIVVYRNP